MKKIICYTFFLFLMSFIFAAPKVPQWVVDKQGAFPYESFISELGSGNSVEAARTNALSRLAGYINVTVTTDRTAVEHSSMTSIDGEESYERKQGLVSVTNITSNAELFCVQYTDAYFNKKDKTYYSVAYIDRKEAWNLYEPKIESAKNQFYNFYKKGMKLADEDPFSAINFLSSAKAEGADFTELCDFGRFISSECQKKYGDVQDEVDSLPVKIEQLFADSKIYIHVTGEGSNSVTQKITELFSSRGFIFVKDKGNAGYILNIEVDLNETVFGKGTEDEMITVYPSINVYLENIETENTVFSLEESVTEKTVAYSKDAAMKKGLKKLSQKLEEKTKDISLWKN